jgi:uncharacterized protein (TIGR02266 family)
VAAAAPAAAPPPPPQPVEAARAAPTPAAAPLPKEAARPIAPPQPLVAPPIVARDASSAEGRTHKRLPFEIHLDIVSEHNFYAGLTLNVSEGGLFVATHVRHPVGTQLEIRLVFPGDDEPTSLMTEVRWVRLLGEAGDSSPGMGLRFVDVSRPVLEKIGRFAKHREPLYYEDD